MRIITSYLLPSSGRVSVNGKNIIEHSLEIRSMIGYLPETPPLYLNMSVKDYVRFAAELRGVPRKRLSVEVNRALEECDLISVKKRIIGELSKGFRQRVGIAQAIVHNPKILILDEPTSGLDPMQVLQVRDLIQSFKSQRTVLLSTHILSEIEKMANRIIVIKEGALIADESLQEFLRSKNMLKKYRLKIDSRATFVEPIIKSVNGFEIKNIEEGSSDCVIRVEVQENISDCRELVTTLLHKGITVLEVQEEIMKIEDSFIRVNNQNE